MTSARIAGAARRGEAASVATRARRSGTPVDDGPALDGGRLRVADEGTRVGLRRLRGLGVVLLFVALLATMFAVAGAHTVLISQQAGIDRTNARISAAEARAEELRVQLAELQSPQYVTMRASTALGMIPAPTPVYLQPRPTDDERAAEIPASTPTTIARAAAPATPPTTAARATATTTTAPRGTATTVKR